MISPVEGVLRVRKDVELDRETIAFYNLTICARDRGVPPLSSTVSLPQLHDNHCCILNARKLSPLAPRNQRCLSHGDLGSPGFSPLIPSQEIVFPARPLALIPTCHCVHSSPLLLDCFLSSIFPSLHNLPLPMPLLPFLCLCPLLLCCHPTPDSSLPQMLVGIRVLDINDNDPVLLNLPMNVTISENSPVSSFVAHVLASDADSGCNALLTFNITAGNRERAFFINATVGSGPAPGNPKYFLPKAHGGVPGSRPQSWSSRSSKVKTEAMSSSVHPNPGQPLPG